MASETGSSQIVGEIGRSRRPLEDERLVRGEGQYVGDIRLPSLLHLAFVRSPHASARLRRVAVEAAAAADGVTLVLTGADVAEPPSQRLTQGGSELATAPAPAIVREFVRTVGTPVAAVVAETPEQALAAAELIEVEYEPLPAVVDPEDAIAEGAPLVHPEFGTNRAFTWHRGTGDVDAAFARASQVASLRIAIPRLGAVPLEPLGVLADWNAAESRLVVWCTTQAPWRVHDVLASALGLPGEDVRVIAPDVGGGFGVRGPVYGEIVVAALAARRLGRPVRYVASRTEDFLITQGSRETLIDAALAADADGHFLGLKARVLTNLGAYTSAFGPGQRIAQMLVGAYQIPAASVELSGIYTNTGVTGAYRGAGRPEAAFVIERLVEEMARLLDVDGVELRRRNFIPPTAFPYRTPLGTLYDSGDYAAALARALELVGYERLRVEQARETHLLGIGLACYVEPTGGGWESGRVVVGADGKVMAITGSVAQGQDHRTTFAQIVADRLGLDFAEVTVRQGDTSDGLPGIGTFGSRSTALGGGALATVADEVYQRARRIAGHLLEAAPEDVTARSGRFSVAGVNAAERSVSWAEVAAAAQSGTLPPELDARLDVQTRFDMGGEAFAFGTCVAVVEVERSTGVVRLRRLALVHDCGTPINPRLVEAQLHGGLAQGAGEALGEWLRYDENGQLLAGSLLDYWLPHADELPSFELASTTTPSPLNPLGAKGVGEAGTIAAPPAILHAVLDALRPLGVRNLDLPLSPERVWQAMQDASRLDHEAH
jgi:aerobic carbon-monoxide dehydrogenase large subunit